jgi:hypothetical protein
MVLNRPPEPPECQFSVGDHVYRLRSTGSDTPVVAGPSSQLHGIVVEKRWSDDYYDIDEEEDGDQDDDEWVWILTVFAFANDSAWTGGLRTFHYRASKWNTVEYRAGYYSKHQPSEVGACWTTAKSDPPKRVHARAQFLLEHSTTTGILPELGQANDGECVAVWCKTGTFATLQACHRLSLAWMGTLGFGGVAALVPMTIPAAGFWGVIGFTTQVSLLTVSPVVLPTILACGVATAGVKNIVQAISRMAITKKLNEALAKYEAVERI